MQGMLETATPESWKLAQMWPVEAEACESGHHPQTHGCRHAAVASLTVAVAPGCCA